MKIDYTFDPAEYLYDAMVDHYDTHVNECPHNDEYECAQQMLAWLDNHNVNLVRFKDRTDEIEKMQTVSREVYNTEPEE